MTKKLLKIFLIIILIFTLSAFPAYADDANELEEVVIQEE